MFSVWLPSERQLAFPARDFKHIAFPAFIAGSSSFESQKMERPSLNVLSPSSPGMLRDAPQLMPGRLSVSVGTWTVEDLSSLLNVKTWHRICFCLLLIQVKLWYDKVGHQLIVNVLQAVELSLRPDGRPRSPYVKMYFLPDRRYANPDTGTLKVTMPSPHLAWKLWPFTKELQKNLVTRRLGHDSFMQTAQIMHVTFNVKHWSLASNILI